MVEDLWQGGEAPVFWERMSKVPVFGKRQTREPRSYRTVYLAHGKMLEEIIKQIIYEPPEYSAEISNSQQGFVRNKSCQTHLISSYDRAISLVERQ